MSRIMALALAAAFVCGCGPTAPAQSGPAPAVDYTTDQVANVRAQTAGGELLTSIGHDPTYFGMAIRPYGLLIKAAGGGSAALRAAVSAETAVPARIEPSHHSMAVLQRLTDRLTHDQPSLHRNGIQLSMWGPDFDSETVKVTLQSYTPSRGAYLLHRYGSELLTVDPKSETVSALS